MAATWIVERARGKPQNYDPLKERAPITDYTPEQFSQIEATLRLIMAVRDAKAAQGERIDE
jgi:hypothetical protein